MATVVSTLYPPTISTFQNAFVNNTDAIIYFSLSAYNSATDINYVHISCVDQATNENALKCYSGLLIQKLKYDEDSGLYYVTIPISELSGQADSFNINQFYKVQIRFDSGSGPTGGLDDEASKNEYFLNKKEYFSEWSSVCLIRPISQPDVRINIFDNYTGQNTISFNKGLVNFSGVVYFASEKETETLQSYRFYVLDKKENIVLSSSTVYTANNVNPNTINHNFDFSSLSNDDVEYVLRVVCCTKNQYQFQKDYDFIIADYNEDTSWKPNIEVSLDNELGVATIHVSNDTAFVAKQTVYIRRASSLDNFTSWENLYVAKHQDIDITIEDNTIASLTWYRYKVELANPQGVFYSNGTRGISSVILPQFYEAILSRGDKQLSINYDYKVTSMKPVVSRTKVDTLGGKYPKFTENAVLGYKQFSISGVLTSEADVYQTFLQKSDVYKDNMSSFYAAYKNNNSIKDLVRNDVANWEKQGKNQYPAAPIPSSTTGLYVTTTQDDWLWEREFREQAVAWLNDGEPKLYRSMAEGNIVVMLTDVSLTPKTQLGRRIWDFTATAYEVADASSIETLDDLGIYTTVKLSTINSGSASSDDDDDDDTLVKSVPGQLYNYTITDTNDIRDSLLSGLKEKYTGIFANKAPDEITLSSVKIYYINKPNLCDLETLNYIKTDGSGNFNAANVSRYQRGYVFNLVSGQNSRNKQILVNSKGYYQIPDEVEVKSLSFRVGDIVTLEYMMTYKEKESSHEQISGSSVDRTVIGQYEDSFQPNVSYGDTIRQKYAKALTETVNNTEIATGMQQMQFWKGIFLEVNPYTVFKIQERDSTDYITYEVGGTGVYYMLKDYAVEDIQFLGIRVKEVSSSKAKYIQEYEYIDYSDTAYNSIGDIKSLVDHGMYSINGSLQIYYNSNWYDFSYMDKDNITNNTATIKTGIVACPIDGIINYYGQVVTTDYA
jgi:hypothetical protein